MTAPDNRILSTTDLAYIFIFNRYSIVHLHFKLKVISIEFKINFMFVL